MKTVWKIVIVVVILALIQGCHTVNGLGQDITKVTEPYLQARE